jgi:hypothetical protein
METGVLIHPRNSQEVSRALDMLIGDEHRRKAMGVAFQHDIMERFSFSAMWASTFALYK